MLHGMVALYAELNPLKVVPLKDRESIGRLAKREGGLGRNSLMYLLFRRPQEARTFQPPMQGVYGGGLSEQSLTDWKTDR